jgi:signal transduction histidine kinase
LTGLDDEAIGIEAVRKGAQDYLVKGQNKPHMLLRAIHHAIERKRMETALETVRIEVVNDKNRLEAVMETLPVGMAIIDIQGGIVRSNKMFEKVWGSPRPLTSTFSDYAQYKAWWLDTNEPVRPGEWASARAVQKRETVVGQLMQIERFDGTRAFVINSAAPILDANGGIVGSAVAILDATDRIEAEKALRELNETLEQRVAERTAVAEQRAQHLRELAAELSQAEHRERTRLAAILHDDLQQLLLAARLRLAGVGRGNEATLRTEIKAVDELLGECLRTSRDLTMDLSPPILHHGALGEVFEWLGGWFNEKHGLTVTVDAQEKLPSVPEHIQTFLFHAVRELLFNAVKHSGMMEAWVSLSSQDGCLTVQVEDRGSGFDPKVVQRNLNRSRSFGLFNIQERLEALEGRLEVESASQGGACFRLIVPVSAIMEPLCERV